MLTFSCNILGCRHQSIVVHHHHHRYFHQPGTDTQTGLHNRSYIYFPKSSRVKLILSNRGSSWLDKHEQSFTNQWGTSRRVATLGINDKAKPNASARPTVCPVSGVLPVLHQNQDMGAARMPSPPPGLERRGLPGSCATLDVIWHQSVVLFVFFNQNTKSS